MKKKNNMAIKEWFGRCKLQTESNHAVCGGVQCMQIGKRFNLTKGQMCPISGFWSKIFQRRLCKIYDPIQAKS
ncbi:hypothetical protein T4B_9918 [Trichinella pseudospiralis]|uniref:Uncharacterized protein n=1 Tax=Trichinella pseudospiralis TaxID=6337 RepID=A0A0V1K6M1_TRIPS|nr:hypothetical protein T4A_13274 [Trichinella pseudospiralis]KRZ24374.1 hypothetical protein T4B_9918 [Trichinella pseudospiralis]KRZ42875.1 hypothetical protein T4C_3158 [Trichinella pseudospiralis]